MSHVVHSALACDGKCAAVGDGVCAVRVRKRDSRRDVQRHIRARGHGHALSFALQKLHGACGIAVRYSVNGRLHGGVAYAISLGHSLRLVHHNDEVAFAVRISGVALGHKLLTSDENLPPVTPPAQTHSAAFVSRTSIAFNVPDTSAVPPDVHLRVGRVVVTRVAVKHYATGRHDNLRIAHFSHKDGVSPGHNGAACHGHLASAHQHAAAVFRIDGAARDGERSLLGMIHAAGGIAACLNVCDERAARDADVRGQRF